MCGNDTFKITFTATKDNPKPPVISDGKNISDPGSDKDFVTEVTQNATIIFLFGGDITSIESVSVEPGVDIFSQNPSPQKDGTWQGTIGNSTSSADTGYTVNYYVGDTLYSQDPKLRIKQ
ncbi:MAG: hypothetical protein KA161_12500 [Saprospiraceae bacterium]|nr:hypothetical protein [Saprospiraceae bacterium]